MDKVCLESSEFVCLYPLHNLIGIFYLLAYNTIVLLHNHHFPSCTWTCFYFVGKAWFFRKICIKTALFLISLAWDAPDLRLTLVKVCSGWNFYPLSRHSMFVYFPSCLWLHLPELKRMVGKHFIRAFHIMWSKGEFSSSFLCASFFLFITQERKAGDSILWIL